MGLFRQAAHHIWHSPDSGGEASPEVRGEWIVSPGESALERKTVIPRTNINCCILDYKCNCIRQRHKDKNIYSIHSIVITYMYSKIYIFKDIMG